MDLIVNRSYNNTDYVALIRLEEELEKDYVAYSDVCDKDITDTNGAIRFYGGVIVWNVYTLDNYFEIDNINHSWRIIDIMIRELLHITCANEVIMNFHKTATF